MIILLVPYLQPNHQNAQYISSLVIQYFTTHLRGDCKNLIKLAREFYITEKSIMKQFVHDTNPIYSKTLLCDTNTIMDNVPTIVGHLFINYWQIEDTLLAEEESKVCNM